jgi:hypothetical protein
VPKPFYSIAVTPAVEVTVRGIMVDYCTTVDELRHDAAELRELADDLDAIAARWQDEDAAKGRHVDATA